MGKSGVPMLGVWGFVAPGGEQRVKPVWQLFSPVEEEINAVSARKTQIVNMMLVFRAPWEMVDFEIKDYCKILELETNANW